MKFKKIGDIFFLISKRERNGTIILLALIVALVAFRICIPVFGNSDEEIPNEVFEKMELLSKEKDEYNSKGLNFSKVKVSSIENKSNDIVLFNFDPNKISLKKMAELGISERVAQNISKYRDNGGRFFKKEDLLKIYGFDSVFYKRLEPYIIFEKEKEKQKKYFEINSTDSASWTTLNGIGPYFAGKICKYRKMLGGFVSKEQIKEVYNFKEETYEKIKGQLKVDTGLVEKINVNFVDISGLKKHPYCRYQNAKKIIDYRSLHGSFNSVEQLKIDSVIDDSTFYRLSPYLIVE